MDENKENIENTEENNIEAVEAVEIAEVAEIIEIEAEAEHKEKKERFSFSFEKVKKSIVGTALILGTVALITALILSVMNFLTAPVIAGRLASEKEEVVARMFGDGTYHEELNDFVISESSPISEVLIVKKSDTDELVGYCVTVMPKGFNGKITMLVAVNPNCTVRDTAVLDESESGKGPNIRKEEFQEHFKGKPKDIKITDIDAIAGATISSKAFLSGVNAALDTVSEIMGR